jgi:hypothetical protein
VASKSALLRHGAAARTILDIMALQSRNGADVHLPPSAACLPALIGALANEVERE